MSKWRPNWNRIIPTACIIFGLPMSIVMIAHGALDESPAAAVEDVSTVAVGAVLETVEEVTTETEGIEIWAPEDVTEASIEEEDSYWADERELLAYVVWGETAVCGEDYTASYLQACVVLNRVRSTQWPDSITEVIYQGGQWVPSWYEYLKETGSEPDAACWQAVDDALAYNSTPYTLVYSDSKDTVPDGCYLYYESSTGQRFYAQVTQ